MDSDALHTVKFAGTKMSLTGSSCCCSYQPARAFKKGKNIAAFHMALLLPKIFLLMNIT